MRDSLQPAVLPRSFELWGGVECTVNRVGDQVFDQVRRSGHETREDDLDRFAALGFAALRFPVLWERTAPGALADADWSWADRRLARTRELGLRPIIGLVHHGSGPPTTDLLDDGFARGLARYAGAVARRYPWVRDFTPVNEPLTTARFSGLYGHWYPHQRRPRSWARMLLVQCRAIVLAMREIRRIRPDARLIQTEDLGKVFSTPVLEYQAQFENERRWLTCDLLTGAVTHRHPLYRHLRRLGIRDAELEWFRRHRCPPDIVGLNYYLTSERFLDHRLDLHPPAQHGGNGRERYADCEAVRTRLEGIAGPEALLREAWARYRLPIAVTEVHNGCTREEQVRWLLEVWDAAERLAGGSVDLRAVTVWALLGSFDWSSLVCRAEGQYEPGAFDVRAATPRATALARAVRDLADGRRPSHPALAGPGWWRRPSRLLSTAFRHPERRRVAREGSASAPLIIAGATGTLGQAFARLCESRGLAFRLLARHEMDIAEARSVTGAIARHRPWGIINAAGYVRVDDAEADPERCWRENTEGAAVLAEVARGHNLQYATFSSDLVFDGAQRRPYLECDPPSPRSVYGRSKAEAEARVLARHPGALVIRTSAFFGPWDAFNVVTRSLQALAASTPVLLPGDQVVSPTYVPDLVDATLDLLLDGESGLWHLANEGAVSWAELVVRAAQLTGLDPTLVEARATSELGLGAPRPAYAVLASERGWIMPPLEHALARYAAAVGAALVVPFAQARKEA